MREEGEVMPGAPELNEEDRRCPVCNIKDDDVISHFKKFHPGTFRSFDFQKDYFLGFETSVVSNFTL